MKFKLGQLVIVVIPVERPQLKGFIGEIVELPGCDMGNPDMYRVEFPGGERHLSFDWQLAPLYNEDDRCVEEADRLVFNPNMPVNDGR
jgi:hypothetical protein